MSAQVTDAGELLASTEPTEPLWRIRTILYIEDNLSNVKLVERILAVQPNVRLLTAMQGRMGLDLAREHRPNLIVLGLHLSDLSDLEILRHLKGDERTAPIPVVMLSADATPGGPVPGGWGHRVPDQAPRRTGISGCDRDCIAGR